MREELRAAGISLELWPGAENYNLSEIAAGVKEGRTMTLIES